MEPRSAPSLVLTTHGDLWGWDHVPVPASTPSATPSISAPLLPTGATEESQELSSEKPLNTWPQPFSRMPATLAIAMSILAGAPGPTPLLCLKYPDSKTGELSVPEQIPLTSSHWAELLRRPASHSPLLSALHEGKGTTFSQVGSASHRLWGCSVFRWNLSFLLQNQSLNSPSLQLSGRPGGHSEPLH